MERTAGWLLVARTPVVPGRDLRDAKPTQGEVGQWETHFVLTQDAAKRFERFTGANIGNRLAIVLDKQCAERSHDSGQDQRQRPDHRRRRARRRRPTWR